MIGTKAVLGQEKDPGVNDTSQISALEKLMELATRTEWSLLFSSWSQRVSCLPRRTTIWHTLPTSLAHRPVLTSASFHLHNTLAPSLSVPSRSHSTSSTTTMPPKRAAGARKSAPAQTRSIDDGLEMGDEEYGDLREKERELKNSMVVDVSA